MSENINLQNEENVIIATFNITNNATITLKNLNGMTSIDWGDGTVNSGLTHEYKYKESETGICEYTCKIYGVTWIGAGAFENCSSLISVTIPNNIATISDYAFYNCSSLTSVYITDIAAWCNISFGVYSNPLYYAKNLYLNNELVTDLAIPEGVTEIKSYAFRHCGSLTSVVIPNSVTTISDNAFGYCDSLTSVEISDSVIEIGAYAFENCESLTSVVMGNGVTSIGEGAFDNCSSLTFNEYGNCKYLSTVSNPYYVLIIATDKNYSNYAIHEDTKIIADGAFFGCSRMTNITIPDSITAIGGLAFSNCRRLKSMVLPNGINMIGDGMFSFCDNLVSVFIPDSVTSIGESAFRKCTSLTSIIIPDSVTTIGRGAFHECSSLTSITFKSLTPISTTVLKDSEINMTTLIYYVPTASIEAYKKAWAGIIAIEQIQADPDEDLINLDGLKTYHKALKEKYLDKKLDKETFENIKYRYVKEGIVNNTETWSDDTTDESGVVVKGDKTKARELISAVGFSDIAGKNKLGVVMGSDNFCSQVNSSGGLICRTLSLDEYQKSTSAAFVSKGTLENIKHNYVLDGLTNYTIEEGETSIWTDDTTENGVLVKGTKTKACETIGAVAKQTEALILYGTDNKGNQTAWSLRNTNNTKNTIAGRDSNGNIQVGRAINATDATNKQYVNDFCVSISQLRWDYFNAHIIQEKDNFASRPFFFIIDASHILSQGISIFKDPFKKCYLSLYDFINKATIEITEEEASDMLKKPFDDAGISYDKLKITFYGTHAEVRPWSGNNEVIYYPDRVTEIGKELTYLGPQQYGGSGLPEEDMPNIAYFSVGF